MNVSGGQEDSRKNTPTSCSVHIHISLLITLIRVTMKILFQTHCIHVCILHQACQGSSGMKNMAKEEGTYAVMSIFLFLTK